jgi:hypothetical protein
MRVAAETADLKIEVPRVKNIVQCRRGLCWPLVPKHPLVPGDAGQTTGFLPSLGRPLRRMPDRTAVNGFARLGAHPATSAEIDAPLLPSARGVESLFTVVRRKRMWTIPNRRNMPPARMSPPDLEVVNVRRVMPSIFGRLNKSPDSRSVTGFFFVHARGATTFAPVSTVWKPCERSIHRANDLENCARQIRPGARGK